MAAARGSREQKTSRTTPLLFFPEFLITIDGTLPIRDVDNRGAMSFQSTATPAARSDRKRRYAGPALVTPTPSTV